MILWTAEPYLDDSETDLLEEIKNLKENLQIEPNADEKEHSSHCTKDLLASLFDV